MKPSVLYVSIIGTPDKHDPALFAACTDTGDDYIWLRNRYAEWGVLDHIDLSVVYICAGETMPEPEGIDAVIVGGSAHSVNENQPWQRDVMDWLERWRATGKPVLGICGGHQMMCVLGGVDVAPRAAGPMYASGPVDITTAGQAHPLFEGFEAAPWFHSGNYDHAIAVPAGATVLATTPDSPVMAVDHGGNWLSVQFHPEGSHDAFACIWAATKPENMKNYIPLPDAPRVLVNFLRLNELIN